jgi:aryl-alcohol dehydrogenase-like predicted oxidoreductase
MNTHTTLGDKPIKRIGFGAMQLAGADGDKRVFGPPDDPDAAKAVLRRAIELGVDHIDTSQYYGPDVVNELIHDALHPYPDDLKLVTKVGARRDAQGGWLGFDEPDQLREAVEANLRTLEVARMDLVNLRILGEDHAGPGEPRPEQLAALEDLRREGKVDLIGVSNMSLDGLRKSVELVEVAEVQNEFSVLNRADEPTLDFCRERGIPYVPFFPLGSAFTGGPRKLASDPAISEIATKHGATPAQIALSWLLHHYDRMLLIPGTASVEHLEENLAAADVELDSDDMERLAAVAQSRP